MKFPYLIVPNLADPTKPVIPRPYIPVRLFYQEKHRNTFGLVDSGADVSIFHASIGRRLGIQIEQGRSGKTSGIGGVEMVTYYHTLSLQVDGLAEIVPLEIGFADWLPVTGLIGEVGFFDVYRITFERTKGEIDIVPVKIGNGH